MLPVDVSRDVWLAERHASIGGSDASTLVGLNPYGSRMQLWLDKTGQLPEQRITTAIEWGILLEPVVRDWLAATYQLTIARIGMLRRPDAPRVHANVDGLVLDDHGRPAACVEIKTTSWRMAHEWADGQCPDHAELQAQLCMWVTGLPVCWVVGLVDGRDPQVRLVHADPTLGEMLAGQAAAFYAEHVEPMAAPALDDSKATLAAVRAAWALDAGTVTALTPALTEKARAYTVATELVREAEALQRRAHSELLVELGDAAEVCDDPDLPEGRGKGYRTTYLTAVNNGTFAAKRFAEEHPDVAEEFTVEVPQLDVAALKAAKPALYRAHCARVIRPRKALTELLAATPEES